MKAPGPSEAISRRSLLKYTILGIGAVVTAGIAAPLVRYLVAPAVQSRKENWVTIATAADIPVDRPTLVEYELRVQDKWVTTVMRKSAWVHTRDRREYTVYDPHCTHLGCPYSWDEAKKQFLCPCHAGVFDIDGKVVSGPPPRALDRFTNKVEDGLLMVLEAV